MVVNDAASHLAYGLRRGGGRRVHRLRRLCVLLALGVGVRAVHVLLLVARALRTLAVLRHMGGLGRYLLLHVQEMTWKCVWARVDSVGVVHVLFCRMMVACVLLVSILCLGSALRDMNDRARSHFGLVLVGLMLWTLFLQLQDHLLKSTSIVACVFGRAGQVHEMHGRLETFESLVRKDVLGIDRLATAYAVEGHALAPLVLLEGARGLRLLLLVPLRCRAERRLLFQAANLCKI